MDKERILILLDQLDQYLKELKKHTPKTQKEYLGNVEKRRFCERTLQLLIEVCTDITRLIVKEKRLGLPEKEESLFQKLVDAKVITKSMGKTLQEMKKFRNVLIHHYTKIDDHIVYNYAKKRNKDFLAFAKELKKYLKNNEI